MRKQACDIRLVFCPTASFDDVSFRRDTSPDQEDDGTTLTAEEASDHPPEDRTAMDSPINLSGTPPTLPGEVKDVRLCKTPTGYINIYIYIYAFIEI